MATPVLHRTEVDGVPVVWAPAPGQFTAALVFRVGRADEQPIDGGVTHLVEHLAMVRVGQPRYDCNAFVDGSRTVFFASGTPADVTAFFDIVTRELGDLPLDRLDKERDILHREQAGRDGSVVEAHRHLRYGMWGHGLMGQPEVGLHTLNGSRIAGWAKFAFTAGNAAMWMTGEPPPDLRLHLAAGVARQAPTPQPIPDLTFPMIVDEVPGFGLGFELAREVGAGTFMSLFHRRLRQRLRLDEGLVYDVLGEYEPLDGKRALALLGADCEPRHVDQVGAVAFEILDALRGGSVSDDELRDEVADLERGFDDPTAIAGLLDATVTDELLGMPARSPDDRLEEQRSTTASDIARRADEARSSAILLATMSAPPDGFRPFPRSSASEIDGREIKPLLSLFGVGRRQRLVIGRRGVTLRSADGVRTTIRYEDCVMLEKPADDELVLWDRDGDRIYIPAIYWRGGGAVLAEIEAAIPERLVVREKFSHDLID